jgi:hypothetical protein
MSGDRRSFARVVKSKLASVVMVPPRPARGWGREGFRSSRGGRGGDSAAPDTPGTTKGGVGGVLHLIHHRQELDRRGILRR